MCRPVFFSNNFRFVSGTLSCAISFKEGATEAEQYLYELVYVIIPNGIALIIVIFSYIGTLCRKRKNAEWIEGTDVSINRLFLYPAVMMVEFLPYIIGKYMGEDGQVMSIALTINFVLTRSIGFLNAIVYGSQMKAFSRKLEKLQESMTNFSSFMSEDRGDFDEQELVMHHKLTRTSF